MAVLGAFMLLLDGASVSGIISVLDESSPFLRHVVRGFGLVGNVLVTWFFYQFPRGRFEPRWLGCIAWFWVLSGLALELMPLPSTPWMGRLWSLHLAVWLLTLAAVQVYRFRTAATHAERQQTKWIMLGVLLGYGTFACVEFARTIAGLNGVRLPFLTPFMTINMLHLLAPFVPITFGMAILRARLYDIDLIISRTLVYAPLTAAVAAVYVVVVGGLGQIAQSRAHPIIGLLMVGMIAIAFQPLRAMLQRSVNRLVYGYRNEPYAVLARLGQQLSSVIAPNELLPNVTETVRDTFKLPYVAVTLYDLEQGTLTTSGAPVPWVQRMPLMYQQEKIGELVIGQRSASEPFTFHEQQLLRDLAQQISIAAHAVRLNHDLQRSRLHLVTAREEERRRLQRDLHDELGPTLASMTMQLDAARALMNDDSATSEALLAEVQDQLKGTVGNVRRLVHQLRPPALDQLGLVAAVREYALRIGQQANLSMVFKEPDAMPALPAAVEVAAYYIAVEALTNAVRHAEARHCTVDLQVNKRLIITVTDNGRGLPATYAAGVGMRSMRERAAELGGTWTVTGTRGGGTMVRAELPL
jgi:signal transduction histidine kinase